jgi:HSP20 family protein
MPTVDVKKTTRSGADKGNEQERKSPTGTELQRRPPGQGALGRPNYWGFSPLDLWGASPFEIMRRISGEIDRTFQGFGLGTAAGSEWAPAVETFERGGRYVVRAELPGIKQDDVRVELSDDGLYIEGERKHESQEEGEGFFRSERSYGRFCRRIPLPQEAMKAEDARAEFKDGVLEVSLPMPESASRRRRVPIQTSGSEDTAAKR